MSQQLSKETIDTLFDIDQERSSERKSSHQNLFMHISKQICQKLGGDLKFKYSEADKTQGFIFSVQCSHVQATATSELALSSQNNSLELDLRRILLVTPNIIDKLAVKFTLKSINLESKLSTAVTIEEAVYLIKTLQVDSQGTQGFAVLILDLGQFNKQISLSLYELQRSLIENDVPYIPKIVNLSSDFVSKKKKKMKSLNIAYELSKPVTKRDMIKMLKKLSYDREAD